MSSSDPPISIYADRASCLDAWTDPEQRDDAIELFKSGKTSFLLNLLPETACSLSAGETLAILRTRWGSDVDEALSERCTDPQRPFSELPGRLLGPAPSTGDTRWLRRSNFVGINLRTVGGFLGAVKYTLCLPSCQDAIHLLPFWEPGVVDSLYGICSWEINEEFFDAELEAFYPHLDSAARQLKGTVNLLHLMGRAVGMDVIPHTDRYSEMALCYPDLFEWLRRDDTQIVDHHAALHEEVMAQILAFVKEQGPALLDAHDVVTKDDLFGAAVDEDRRQRLLFGEKQDRQGREDRRIALVKHLHALGFEPVPATMAPPYRGLAVDDRAEACTTDEHGMVWRDYCITAPEPMSRVFGPLGRYKLYQRLEDNARWQVDFSQPREHVWRYVCDHYAAVQRSFGFDFMRGDMSHVQMRPDGPPLEMDDRYDLLMAIKCSIQTQNSAPHFAYFAESFLAPPDVMGYGDEIDHLELSGAEATLGNLQSMAVDDLEFPQQLRRYLDIGATRTVAPCLTMMTADKDDPRFDEFYLWGNELRFFLGLFVADLPSYMGLGFEVRDPHPQPAPNEHYTKLYVFQQREGKNATQGPFSWGHNTQLFAALGRVRLLADELRDDLGGGTSWLLPPDPTLASKLLCWTQEEDPHWVFLCSMESARSIERPSIPRLQARGASQHLTLRYTTSGPVDALDHRPSFNGQHHRLFRLGPGECRVYRVES